VPVFQIISGHVVAMNDANLSLIILTGNYGRGRQVERRRSRLKKLGGKYGTGERKEERKFQ
jgi:hypothetical protein